MLIRSFSEVYTKFKLHFYRSVFARLGDREASLTTVETFCMEIIHALGKPTVNEFASFIAISPPNAAYKVTNLISKGYLEKIQSLEDKREYYLIPTKKYFDYYNISQGYMETVADRVSKKVSEEEIKIFEKVLIVMSEELMPEMNPINKEML